MAEVEVFVQREGIRGTELVKVSSEGTVGDLLEGLRARHLHEAADKETAVYLEDSNEPVAVDQALGEVGIRANCTVYVGRHGQSIEVSVNFQGESKSTRFGPGVRIRTILDWFTGTHGFDLSPGAATELTLQFCGSGDRPKLDEHIGSVIPAGTFTACFDLVLKAAVQG